jgi:GGDEF domain-containing protein
VPPGWVTNLDASSAHSFERQATRAGIPPLLAGQFAPAGRRDAVTGAFDGRGGTLITDMINRARHRVASSDEPVHLVAIDISNLGGLNQAVGRTRANEHLDALVDIASSSLRSAGGRVAVARAGGDEFYLLVSGIDGKALATAIDGSIRPAVRQYAHSHALDGIAHRKPDRPAGVGLYFGVAPVSADQSAAQIRSAADAGVDAGKAGRFTEPA